MPSKKTTPAIQHAEHQLEVVLAYLKRHDLADLFQRIEASAAFTDEQQEVLLSLIFSLHHLVEAEQVRDSGGGQQDMFAHLEERDFAAWQTPINQRALF